MPHKAGHIDCGHPYVDIIVSKDGKNGIPLRALIDTGFSGLVSLPIVHATMLALQPHTSTRYQLANGKQSDPVPLAQGHACVDGDVSVAGLISISENASVLVGVEFLRTCGKGLMVFSQGVLIVDEKEFIAELQQMQEAQEQLKKAQTPPAPEPPQAQAAN